MSAILFSGEQMSGHGDADVVCFLPISPSGIRQSWPLNRLISSSPVAILLQIWSRLSTTIVTDGRGLSPSETTLH